MMFPEMIDSIFSALDAFQTTLGEELEIQHHSDDISEMDVVTVRPHAPVIVNGKQFKWDMSFMDNDLTITVAADGQVDWVVAILNKDGYYVPTHNHTGKMLHPTLNAYNLGKAFITAWRPPAKPVLN
jgi:hypothetical protein